MTNFPKPYSAKHFKGLPKRAFSARQTRDGWERRNVTGGPIEHWREEAQVWQSYPGGDPDDVLGQKLLRLLDESLETLENDAFGIKNVDVFVDELVPTIVKFSAPKAALEVQQPAADYCGIHAGELTEAPRSVEVLDCYRQLLELRGNSGRPVYAAAQRLLATNPVPGNGVKLR